MKPQLVAGGIAVDDRGALSFVPGFSFAKIKRFYVVENFSLDTIRAWHGHKKESKYVMAAAGSAIVGAVSLKKKSKPQRHILSAKKPAILHIPPGYANGFRSLEPRTILLIFSTSTLELSQSDDIRFPWDHWGKEIWEVEHR